MVRRSSKKTTVYDILREHETVEPDFAFWMEHVVHWHALLFAVIAVLSVGYFFFSKQAALAMYVP